MRVFPWNDLFWNVTFFWQLISTLFMTHGPRDAIFWVQHTTLGYDVWVLSFYVLKSFRLWKLSTFNFYISHTFLIFLLTCRLFDACVLVEVDGAFGSCFHILKFSSTRMYRAAKKWRSSIFSRGFAYKEYINMLGRSPHNNACMATTRCMLWMLPTKIANHPCIVQVSHYLFE